MGSKKANLYPYWLTLPAVLTYSFFYFLPLMASMGLSITDWNSRRFWTPEFNGLENYILFFLDSHFKSAIVNTFLFAAVTAFFKVFLGLLLALALIRPLKTRGYLRTVFYMPAVLSSVIIGIVFTSVFRMNGLFTELLNHVGMTGTDIDWLGTYQFSFPIIMFTEIWQWSGFTMIIFIAGLQSIPKEYYDSSDIDGASMLQQFKNITMPMLSPAFKVAVTISIIGGLRVFTQVMIMTNGGPGFETDVLSRYIYVTFSEGFYGKASAISLVQSLIIIFIVFVIEAYMKKKEVSMS